MLRLGITGGIGSGKTSVCRIFETLGVPVYYADVRAKQLVEQEAALKDELIKCFGAETFQNGKYNRPYIAGIVFSDKNRLEQLNSIIHPYVLKDWEKFCSEHKDSVYVVKEAAIMLETQSRDSVDRIYLVYAPADLRIIRVMKRDGSQAADIKARMDAQMPEEEKMAMADGVILNDGKNSLIDQVRKLHSDFISGRI